jgi:hypothetical protein
MLKLARKSQFFCPGKCCISFSSTTERLESKSFTGPSFCKLWIDLDRTVACSDCLIVFAKLFERIAFVDPGFG